MQARTVQNWVGLARLAGLGIVLGMLATGGAGCAAAGALLGSFEATGSHDVVPEYQGLEGKDFAVVVRAGQLIQADYPEVVVKLTNDLSTRLAKESGGSGYVPGPDVVNYLYNHPRWVAMPIEDLAKELKVQRIVYVELSEYRLQDPGNSYLWQGVCGAMVGIVEADGMAPEEFAYRKQLRITYPEKSGYGPNDLPRAAVNTELVRRTVDRVSWLFYQHEEKNHPDY